MSRTDNSVCIKDRTTATLTDGSWLIPDDVPVQPSEAGLVARIALQLFPEFAVGDIAKYRHRRRSVGVKPQSSLRQRDGRRPCR